MEIAVYLVEVSVIDLDILSLRVSESRACCPNRIAKLNL